MFGLTRKGKKGAAYKPKWVFTEDLPRPTDEELEQMCGYWRNINGSR